MDDTQDIQSIVEHAGRLSLDNDFAGVVAALAPVRKRNPKIQLGPRLAYAYRALRRFAEAEAEYSAELSQAKDDPILLEGRAYAREELGDWSGALEDLRGAEKKAPNDHSLLAHLAAVESRLGLVDRALVHLDVAIFAEPDFWPHHFDQGVLYARLERWSDAEKSMSFVIKRIQDAPAVVGQLLTALSFRGWARIKLGHAPEALADLDEAVRLGPGDPQALCFRAVARTALNDPKALEDFDAALEAEPDYPFALGLRGEYHLLVRRDKKAALADFQHAAKVDPEHASLLEENIRKAQS